MPKEEKTTEKPLSPELRQLQDLYDLMLEKGLDVVELKDEESRVKLARRLFNVAPVHSVPLHAPARGAVPVAAAAPKASSPASSAMTIPTPLAGVFYRASSPNSAAFVKEGDAVEAGQTLCIVEAMKVMNEIKAETRCRILKIVAENGRPVTASQPLFQIEPA